MFVYSTEPIRFYHRIYPKIVAQIQTFKTINELVTVKLESFKTKTIESLNLYEDKFKLKNLINNCLVWGEFGPNNHAC